VSTATHDVADTHETAVKSSASSVLTDQCDPFQVFSDSENATAQKSVVGHDTVPGSAAKVGDPGDV
jgi:hypothetical protein